MNCTRCDAQHAAVTRDGATYCETCVMVLDWQILVALVQDAQVTTPVAGESQALRSA